MIATLVTRTITNVKGIPGGVAARGETPAPQPPAPRLPRPASAPPPGAVRSPGLVHVLGKVSFPTLSVAVTFVCRW